MLIWLQISSLKARLSAVSEAVQQHRRRESSLREHIRREVEDRHCLDTKKRNLEYESTIKVRSRPSAHSSGLGVRGAAMHSC